MATMRAYLPSRWFMFLPVPFYRIFSVRRAAEGIGNEMTGQVLRLLSRPARFFLNRMMILELQKGTQIRHPNVVVRTPVT
jgi:hypothetical protein